MADMTSKDFEEQVTQLGQNPSDDAVIKLLENIGSLDGYDTESLDKLTGLMEGRQLNANLSDSLKYKIEYQRKFIEFQTVYSGVEQTLPPVRIAAVQPVLQKMSLPELAQLKSDIAKGKIKDGDSALNFAINKYTQTNMPALAKQFDNEKPAIISNPETVKNVNTLLDDVKGLRNTPAVMNAILQAKRKLDGIEDKETQEYFREMSDDENTPAPQTPDSNTPDNQDNTEEFENRTSYDLVAEYAQLLTNTKQLAANIQAGDNTHLGELAAKEARMKSIENYAAKELSETELNADNAPMAADYIRILISDGKELPEELKQKFATLNEKLAQYDKENGLDGELASAEEYVKNSQEWKKVITQTDYHFDEVKNDDMVQKLPDSIKKETANVLYSQAVRDLSFNNPESSENPQQAVKDKMMELGAKYLAVIHTLNEQLPTTDNEEVLKKQYAEQNLADTGFSEEDYVKIQKDLYKQMLEEYLKANNITAEDWNKAANTDHPASQKIRDGFQKFISSDEFAKHRNQMIINSVNAMHTANNNIFTSRLMQKNGMQQAPRESTQLHQQMTENHPQYMSAAKGILKTLAVGALFGPIGLTIKQGKDLIKDVNASWKRFSELTNNGEKVSKWSIKNWKNFRAYLKENPDERLNLKQKAVSFMVSSAATLAIVGTNIASGGVTAGLSASLGISGGLAAGLAGTTIHSMANASLHVAGQTLAINKVRAVANTAIALTFGRARYLNAKKEAQPFKDEMLAILNKPEYQEALAAAAPQKTGLLSIFSSKDPAKRVMNDLTGALFNGEDKMTQKIMALPLSPEDKEKVMALAVQLKNINKKATMAAAGATLAAGGGLLVAGGGAEWVSEKVNGLLHGHDTPTPNVGHSNTGPSNYDWQKPYAENAQNMEHWEPKYGGKGPEIQSPYAPGELPHEISGNAAGAGVTIPSESLERGGSMWYATQMGPMALKEKLTEMGLGNQMQELQGSRSYIPSRIMEDYLRTAKFTPEQAKELQDYISDRPRFDADCARINAQGSGSLSHGGSGGAAHAQTGNGNTPQNPADNGTNVQGQQNVANPNAQQQQMQQTPPAKPVTVQYKSEEQKTWLGRVLGKKDVADVNYTPTGDDMKDGVNIAARKALMREGIDPDKLTPQQLKAAYAELNQKGYSETGSYVDENGVTHKLKVKVKGGVTKITLDGVRQKVTQTGDGTSVLTFDHKSLPSNTVGAPDGKEDQLLGREVRNGVRHEYIRDGNSKYVYERDVDAKNNPIEGSTKPSQMSYREVKAYLKSQQRS